MGIKISMRCSLGIFFVIIFSLVFISSEIIINEQPKEVYNLGDSISVPLTIKPLVDVSEIFEMNILCSGREINFYRNGVGLKAGEEKEVDATLLLVSNMIGEVRGACKIKAVLGNENVLTNEFRISEIIYTNLRLKKTSVLPNEGLLVEGDATKEDGKPANGFADLEILSENSSILFTKQGTINNGYFIFNFTIPEKMKAGNYIARVKVYEKSNDKITNNGFSDIGFNVGQVPVNVEVFFENKEIEPGSEVKVKAILHDQTGDNIANEAVIILKDGNGKIVDEVQVGTDEFVSFLVPYNSPPNTWSVSAVAKNIKGEGSFKVLKKEDILVELVNRTIVVTNIGNVPYNKTLLVKIGNNSLNLDINLLVDEVGKYVLTAPDGEYGIEVRGDGESKFQGMAVLTGDAVGVEKASSGFLASVGYSFVWFFIVAIIAFFVFMVVRKGYKKSFIGRIHKNKEKDEKSKMVTKKSSVLKIKNKAELSLSIKGEKQDVLVTCLNVKNLNEIITKFGPAKDAIQNVINVAEENKAFVYENDDNLFFIFSPAVTKTFKNEESAIGLANNVYSILKNYNKLFKQQMLYGISLHYGGVLAKLDRDSFKFMSLGNLITLSKRISVISEGTILLSEAVKERLSSSVIRTVKHDRAGIVVYSISEIKEKKDYGKFLQGFLKRMDDNPKKK